MGILCLRISAVKYRSYKMTHIVVPSRAEEIAGLARYAKFIFSAHSTKTTSSRQKKYRNFRNRTASIIEILVMPANMLSMLRFVSQSSSHCREG